MDQSGAGLGRTQHVEIGRKLLVFDEDFLGEILRLGTRLGQHHRHRFADEAHLATRQRRLGGYPEARQSGLGENVFHPHHVGMDESAAFQMSGNMHRCDAGVGERRAHEGGFELARKSHVTDEAPAPGEEARILLAANRGADATMRFQSVFHSAILPLPSHQNSLTEAVVHSTILFDYQSYQTRCADLYTNRMISKSAAGKLLHSAPAWRGRA